MADKYIHEALKRNHLKWNIWDTDGELAYKKGEYKRCVASMSNAITICNKNANSYYYRGLANVKLNNHSQAFNDFEILKTLDSLKADTLRASIDMSKVDLEKITENEIVVVSPKTDKTKNGLTVRAVELSSEYTALYLTHRSPIVNSGYTYCVNKDAYIVEKETGKRLMLLKADNCPIAPKIAQEQNGKSEFVLYFPAVSKNCKEIDFFEGDALPDMEGWSITGIQMKSGKKGSQNTIDVEDVIVTDKEEATHGMIYVKTVEETSAWADADRDLKNCIKRLKKEAARNGCSLILITNISSGSYSTSVTAKMYRMP